MTTIKNLLLALLNATLILVALCLYLGWMVMQSAEQAADTFASAVGNIAPIRNEVSDVKDSVAGLRADLQLLAGQPGVLSETAEAALESRVNVIAARLDRLETSLAALSEVPENTVEAAIDLSANRAADLITQFRSCTPDDPA